MDFYLMDLYEKVYNAFKSEDLNEDLFGILRTKYLGEDYNKFLPSDCSVDGVRCYLQYVHFEPSLLGYFIKFDNRDVVEYIIDCGYCFYSSCFSFLYDYDLDLYEKALRMFPLKSGEFAVVLRECILRGYNIEEFNYFERIKLSHSQWLFLIGACTVYNPSKILNIMSYYSLHVHLQGSSGYNNFCYQSILHGLGSDDIRLLDFFLQLGFDMHYENDHIYKHCKEYGYNRMAEYLETFCGCSSMSPLEREYLSRVLEEVR